MEENIRVKDINISNEMENSFLDYAMSVIVSRALPDARDGLKPVHRRVLYAMNQISNHADKPYQKSARTVGEVIGKYHPHSDTSVYDTMVRMAQDFSYRYMLVQGHGNFGSIDGDGAAAMRYTEARMSKIAMELLKDINKNTVDFRENYDGREFEPCVMPAKFPNLLVNGATGIAVGMATNIPPHNLSEVIDGVVALASNADITIDELMNYIKGPDYPTGGTIIGVSGIRSAYRTGRGSVVTRAKYEVIEAKNGKKTIIVTEIPYQVNKAKLIEKIADLVRNKVIEGITDLRDESSRKGLRIVIELRRDIVAEVMINKLFKLTPLQSSFGFNNITLVDGQPRLLNLKETLEVYLAHQKEVITRRTQFDLEKAEAREHILLGLKIALDNIDRVIEVIKKSQSTQEAQIKLCEEFALSETQAKAILEMRLNRLTGLEWDKIIAELTELGVQITDFKDILANEQRVADIVVGELTEIKEKFGDERRSYIDTNASLSIEDEDLIPVEDVVITLSAGGYAKRVPIDEYRAQNRGGVGSKGVTTNAEDSVEELLITTTHTDLMFFTNAGKVYRLRAHEIPAASRQSKGLPLVNLIDIEKDEKVQALLTADTYNEDDYILFATVNGLVKRTKASEFSRVRKSGKIAITLKDGDALLDVISTNGNQEIILGGSNGKAVRFDESSIRPSGRSAAGVKGMNVDGGKVISLATPENGKYLLVVSSNGFGKMTEIEEYRKTSRGSKGVKTINVTDKTGELVEIAAVNGDEELMLVTKKGIVIRLKLSQVKIAHRNTQGVTLIKVSGKGNEVASASVVRTVDEEITDENIEDEFEVDTIDCQSEE